MWLLLNFEPLHGRQMLMNFSVPIKVIQLLNFSTCSFYNNKYMQTINKTKTNYKS
jgi:hypothetical protein